MEVRVPYLENGYYPGLKDISKRKGRRLIKTHLPQNLLPESAKQNKSKIIYIYRIIIRSGALKNYIHLFVHKGSNEALDKIWRSQSQDHVGGVLLGMSELVYGT